MKILKYDIIRYERTDVMNYKINMKCELKNVSETLKDKQEELKKYYLELNTMYLKQKEKVAYYYEDINTGSILSYNSENSNVVFFCFLKYLIFFLNCFHISALFISTN